jgi:arylsulfatase A-like enzyme
MPVIRFCSRPVVLFSSALMFAVMTSCFGGEADLVADSSPLTPPVSTLQVSTLAQPKALVIVMIDALRPDDLGLYGSARPTSPELDRLAVDSLVFEQASASAPKTIPSVPQAFSSSLFPDIELGRTLMEVLSDHGWNRSAAVINNPYVGNWVSSMRPSFADVQSGDLNAEAIVDAALAQIDGWRPEPEQAEGEPWALFLHFLDTHTPYKVPQPWAGKFVSTNYAGPVALRFDDVAGAWAGRYGPPSQRQIRNLYAGTVAYTDHHLGRLVKGLKDRGLYDETAILVTADHGEEFWDHGGFFHGQSLFDELLRVPLLLKLPGNVGAGLRCEAPVGLIDIVPTVAELLSAAQLDPKWLGVSLLGALTKELSMARLVPAVVGRPDSGRPERHGLRGVGVKYVADVVDGTEHLFDLKADPEERKNLATTRPEKLPPLRDAWTDFARPLREHGFHLEVIGAAGRDERWTASLRMQPQA